MVVVSSRAGVRGPAEFGLNRSEARRRNNPTVKAAATRTTEEGNRTIVQAMKRLLLFTTVLCLAINSYGQGFITWGNNPTGFRAPIYSATTGLLTGTGYTFAVYTGPAGVTDTSALTLLVSTTFRTTTATGQTLPKGLVNGATTTVPGVQAGESCKFQIRAWDNLGGTVTTWEQALPYVSEHGYAPMLLSAPLGGVGTDGTEYATPATGGWQSFTIIIPEPATWAVGLLAMTILTGWKRFCGKLSAANRNHQIKP